MGTFDQLNFRLNGYQFHVDLMAGKEPWNDDKVKETSPPGPSLLPFHQENPNGRTWEEAAAAVVNKEAGMMTIGTFIGSQFPEDEFDDIDFFPFPGSNDEHGTRHRRGTDRRLDDGEVTVQRGRGQGDAGSTSGPGWPRTPTWPRIPASSHRRREVDTGVYNDLQPKVQEAVAECRQRDPVPRSRHQSGVRLERGRTSHRRLPGRPDEDRLHPRRHARAGRGHPRTDADSPAAGRLRRGALSQRSIARTTSPAFG